MKKIVIFQDKIENDKRFRVTLRSISPSTEFGGFTKNGTPIDSEIKKLCRYLEPSFTGYYIA